MDKHKKEKYSEKAEKSVSLEDSVIYKELQQRNHLLLGTAFVLLIGGIVCLIPVFLERNSLFLFIGGFIFLLSVSQFYLVYRRNENIFQHPNMAHFLKWGEGYGNYFVLMDEELKQNKRTKFSNAFFTDNFVFKPSFYGFDWFHFSETCWAYNHVTQHSINFIPTGKTYKVHIHLDDGSLFDINSDSSGEILSHLIKTAPFAFYGYDDELKKRWSDDKENFIKTVKYRMHRFFENPEKFIKEHYIVKEEQ